LTGSIGDLIFRNYNGKTVVSARPVYKNETNTEARKQARGRFQQAAWHASLEMEDPIKKAYYQKKAKQLKLPNAYTAALTDYLRKGKATVMKPKVFKGRKGDKLFITVKKPVFKINNVKVVLYNKQDEVLSEQTLSKAFDQHTFQFKFTDDFPDYDKLKIIADEPGDNIYTIHAKDFVAIAL
jgi:hypothetical protein